MLSDPGAPLRTTVRSLTDADRAAVLGLFLSLDQSSRYARFGRLMTAHTLGAYVDALAFRQGCILGLFVDGTLAGVGEICPLPDSGGRHAELAIVIASARQGCGYGADLLRHMIEVSLARGLTGLSVACAGPSSGMQTLLARLDHRSRIHWTEHRHCLDQAAAGLCDRTAVIALGDGA